MLLKSSMLMLKESRIEIPKIEKRINIPEARNVNLMMMLFLASLFKFLGGEKKVDTLPIASRTTKRVMKALTHSN